MRPLATALGWFVGLAFLAVCVLAHCLLFVGLAVCLVAASVIWVARWAGRRCLAKAKDCMP